MESGYVLKKTASGFELLERPGNILAFNAAGKLTSIKDLRGNTATLGYDTNGKLTTIMDVIGRTIYTFTHTPEGRIATITDIANRIVKYEYDSAGNLIRAVHGTQAAGAYTYNSHHGLTTKSNALNETYTIEYYPVWENKGIVKRIIDPVGTELIKAGQQPIGHEMTFTYDFSNKVYYYTDYRGVSYKVVLNSKGQVLTSDQIQNGQTIPQIKKEYLENRTIKTTDALGNATTVQRDEWGAVTRKVDASGNEWKYTYDNQSRPLTITDPLGTITKYEYDQYGNRTKVIVAAGTPDERVTTFTYNQYNKLTTTTDENSVITYGYDIAGNNIEIKDPLGNITTMTYDSAGNLLSRTQPLIGATTYSNYDYKGKPGTISDVNGNVSLYTYDALGRVKTITNQADNATIQFFYIAASGACTTCGGGEGAGKIDYIILPEGNKIDYDYDNTGNIVRIADNAGNSVNYTYDSKGNRIKEEIKDVNEALQKTLGYQYDLLNRLTKTINPDNTYTENGYDSRGNSISIRNPKANMTNYEFDAVNRLIKVIQPGNIITTYTYDRKNNLKSVIDADGNRTSYEYDKQNRITRTVSPDTGTTTYTHDLNGNPKTKTDAKGVITTYIYDALNRLTTIDFPTDVDIIYTYDTCVNGKGKMCTMTDASGTTSYEYTPKGQIKKETKAIDGVTYVTHYSYDRNGNLNTMTYPSGRVITYTLSNDKVIGVLNDAANLATNINYKPFGGMSLITYGNGLTGSISYDNQYRITGITASTVMNLSYPTYDANGNITAINNVFDPTKNKSFTYDSLDRLSTATSSGIWGTLSWTYDAVGNRQVENSNSYTYAPNTNKLIDANGIYFGYDNNGNTTTEDTRQYMYNQNQRLIKVTESGAVKDEYVYNGNGQRVKKTVAGQVTIFHYSQSGQIIAESNSTGSATAEYVYLNAQPLAKIEGTNTYFYHNDHLGTPQVMTDANKAVVWSADYKPFGEATITVSTITNNLRFPGQYYDAETNLHYNFNRDYNSGIGRYVEADQIGIQRGQNHLYIYVGNNPIKRIDPFGLAEEYPTEPGVPFTPTPPPPMSQEQKCFAACRAAFILPCVAGGVGIGVAAGPEVGFPAFSACNWYFNFLCAQICKPPQPQCP